MADTHKGSGIGEKAQEAASSIQQGMATAGKRAQEMGSDISRKAQDLASQAGDGAESALSSVGEGMSSLAGTIRECAPHEGMVGQTASAVAGSLESGGRYLQEHGLSGMTEDLGSLIRTYPITSVCVAFSLGCLVTLSCRR
jgi:hypothetical protein